MADDDTYEEEYSDEASHEEKVDDDELSAVEQGFLKGYEQESEPEEEFGIDSEPEDEE